MLMIFFIPTLRFILRFCTLCSAVKEAQEANVYNFYPQINLECSVCITPYLFKLINIAYSRFYLTNRKEC